MHSATIRAVRDFYHALGAPAVDLGLVAPPKDSGLGRGCALWFKRDLALSDLIALLPRAAAANVRGEAVYVRMRAEDGDNGWHPGVILLDDLCDDALGLLEKDGFEPSAVVETSPRNFQAWVRVAGVEGIIRREALLCARELATRYRADPRAVSSTQPGRLPGFTNRKPKYLTPNGRFPFVRLIAAHPRQIASRAPELLANIRTNHAQPGGARRAPPPKTPPEAAPAATGNGFDFLDEIREIAVRKVEAQVQAGKRPIDRATASEVDWAAVQQALREGLDPRLIETWLRAKRPDHHAGYASLTLTKALSLQKHQDDPTTPPAF